MEKPLPRLTSSVAAYEFAKSFIKSNDNPVEPITTSQTEILDGPSQHVGEINYKKWQDFANQLEHEENAEKAKNLENNSMYSGCSHDHSKERQMFERPIDEQLKASQRLNDEGNQAFKDTNYGLASVFYRKALIQSDYCFPEKDEDVKTYNEIKLNSLLNLSACKLKTEAHNEVLDLCNQALEIDNTSSKAYYRLGLAYTSKFEYKDAKKNFLKALEFQPKNSQIYTKLNELRKLEENYLQKRAKMYSEMLSNNRE